MNWDELEKTLAEATPGPWIIGETGTDIQGRNTPVANAGGWAMTAMDPRDERAIKLANTAPIAQTPDLARLALAGRKLAAAMVAEIEHLKSLDGLFSLSDEVLAALAEWREVEGEK